MRNKQLLILLYCVFFLFLSGCGEVLDEKKTEIEAKKLLEAASEIRYDSDVTTPVPERILADPTRVKVAKGVKVFYYAKNHSPKILSEVVNKQLKLDVTTLDSANQIVIACGDDKAADEALEFLSYIDIPPIQVRINCVVVENYADLTMDKETTVAANELFNSNLTMSTQGDDLPSFPGASVRETERSDMGMTLGIQDSDSVTALVDMLVSRGYFKVLMNPVVETLVGNAASVTATERVPTTKIVTKTNVDPYQETEYIWIEDTLKVTPNVYQDGTIGLTTDISIGSKSTPEGVIQRTVITEKKASFGENRIRIGESLIIGGFRKMENSAVTRGFPFLKDLPFIGFLFSGEDYEQRAKEITFILTPSISSNGMPYEDMIEWAKEKLSSRVKDKDLSEIISDTITDPLGKTDSHTDSLEKAAANETVQRIQAEMDIADVEQELDKLRGQIQKLELNLHNQQLQSQEAEKVKSDYEVKLNQLKDLKVKLEGHIEQQKQAAEKAAAEKVAAEKAAAQAAEEAKAAEVSAEKPEAKSDDKPSDGKVEKSADKSSGQAEEAKDEEKPEKGKQGEKSESESQGRRAPRGDGDEPQGRPGPAKDLRGEDLALVW